MGYLSPTAAYAAALEDDGSVVARDLSDPTTRVVIVVEFDRVGSEFKAFYHGDLDRWEVFGPDDYYQMSGPDRQDYLDCDRCVEAFRDRLHDWSQFGSIAHKLSKAAIRDMQEEIDRDILNSLRICVGQPPLPPPVYIPPPIKNHKMVPKWSMDKDELKPQHQLVGTSRLVKQRRPS